MPNQSWQEVCEVVTGAVIRGRLHPMAVSDLDMLMEPYKTVIGRKQKKDLSHDDVLDILGPSAFERCVAAVDRYKNTNANFLNMLRKSVSTRALVAALQKEIDRIERGEESDASAVISAYSDYGEGQVLFERLDLIDDSDVEIEACGYEPFDKELGGLPSYGITIVAGTTGTGKTHLARSIATGYASLNKKVGIFSLEMTKGEMSGRFKRANVPKKLKKYIFIADAILAPGEVAAAMALNMDKDVFIIDFADLLIRGEVTEAAMSMAYKVLMVVAKELRKKIIVLAQFNRGYDGNMPRISYIKFASTAEQLAKMIILAHNPTQVVAGRSDDTVLPLYKGKAYLMAAKSRAGFGMGHSGPGAILVEFNGKSGWGDVSLGWTSLGSVD